MGKNKIKINEQISRFNKSLNLKNKRHLIMEKPPNQMEKVIFSISFLTVLVTVIISGYKDFLINARVLIFFYQVSLFDLLISMSIFLFFSVYFSALYNLRFCKINFIGLKLFDKLYFFADLFYFIAILLIPIIIFISYSVSVFTFGSIKIFNYISVALIKYYNLYGSSTYIPIKNESVSTYQSLLVSIVQGLILAIVGEYIRKLGGK